MIKFGSDFSGIGAPEAALKRLNLPTENIFACEIDKYAKNSFLELHRPITFYNDITTRNHSEVPNLDLYVAGFPCQSFSLAGKRGGFEDTRGTLFFNVAKFIKENEPKCFVLENVKGLISHDSGKTFQTITDILTNGGGTLNGQTAFDTIENGLGYHVYTKVLNTKDYGIPQNRERIFIVGFKYFRYFSFPKPFELKLKLKHLLESDVDYKHYLSDKAIKSIIENKNNLQGSKVNPEISSALQSPGNSCGTYKGATYINVHSLHPRTGDPSKCGTGRLSKSDGTTYCLDTSNSQAIEIKGAALRGRGKGKELEIRKDNLANSITTVQTDSIIKSNTIRRLTPLECWRLQGFTDDEFYKAQKVNSDTQLYKQAGNTITVNVLVELFKKIYLK